MNESEKVEYELTDKIRVVSAQSFSFPIWITDNVVVPVRVGESSTCHLVNPRRVCTAIEGYSTWSVCLCVCVSVTQHLTLNVIIHATNDSNLPSGG